ncbi:MAG: glycosyltransferase, partial [Bacteroidales bacterium]|nr:glycosyltransferase [Bacteroidales bacterium]
MKKILFFHFDLGVGGAENVLINLLNNLNPKKYDITLLLLFNHGVRINDLAPHIKLKYVFNFKPFRGISNVLKMVSPRFLHKCFVKDTYDIEIAYLEGNPTRIVGSCPNSQTKCFAWVHRAFFNRTDLLHVYRSNKEMLRTYKHMNGIAFVSDTARDVFMDLSNIHDANLKVVNNVLELEHIIEASKAEAPIDKTAKVNFCSVGRLTAQKNFIRLFNVLGTLYNEGIKDWHLYLLGKGEEQEQLVKLMNKHHLDNNISMLGFDSNPHRYVSKMDFFVCSSLYEGYSTAVTESIILHTPVITTDCSGMSEIFGDSGCGMIVENSDQGLLDGMRRMLTQPELVSRMKACAIERSKFFSKERCIKQFETFIEL